MEVLVTDVVAGLPAKIRLAHAAGGYGPLTFVPNQGTSVTLSLGESVEMPIVSGTFNVHVDGLRSDGPSAATSDHSWLVRGGDHLEIFATEAGVTGWWVNQASVPADSGLVRFVQGTGSTWWAAVVLLGAPGAGVVESRLIDCYFDPYGITEYVRVPTGEFDVIAGGKGLINPGGVEVARGRVTATSGRAVTYAITGDSPQTMRLLAFPDF
jgi:hypothetical protein